MKIMIHFFIINTGRFKNGYYFENDISNGLNLCVHMVVKITMSLTLIAIEVSFRQYFLRRIFNLTKRSEPKRLIRRYDRKI